MAQPYNPPAHFVLGAFNLDAVIIQDNQAFANAMQRLIERGSIRDNIGVAEIQAICDVAAHTQPGSVSEAVEHGMRFFDALLYFALPVADRPNVVVSPNITDAALRQPMAIAVRLFYLGFYLMTRGNLPQSDTMVVGADVPGLLANVYALGISPNQLATDLGGIAIRRLNHRWIRYINWANLDVIPRNRLGLGVAGYRHFAVFKLVPLAATVQNNIDITLAARDAAYNTARHIANAPADWNIHPVTRNPAVTTALGSLNGNLNNLMLACYSGATLAAIRLQGIIYVVPQENPRFNNYKTWNVNMVTFLTSPIVLG